MKSRLVKAFNKFYNDFLFFVVWRLVFFFHSLFPVDKNLVVFVASCDKTMPKEYRLLYEKAESNGYKCVCLYDRRTKNAGYIRRQYEKMKYGAEFQRYYARAKTTFLYEYYLPAFSHKPRKGSRLVQLWHGCGAFKKFSYSTRDSKWGLESKLFDRYKVHKSYTDIVASGGFIVPEYTEAFNADDGIIKVLGVPRTDVYFDSDFVKAQKDILLKTYPGLTGKRLVLWAPTFRGNNMRSSYNDKAIDFVKLAASLDSDTVFLIKLHPFASSVLTFSEEEKKAIDGKILNISDTVSTETALCCADVVITDYSSLIFEYALLSRPMIFYAYDLDEYEKERGFYYDYRSFVPGKIAKNTDELIDCIKNAERDFDKNAVEAFKNKFMSACDGHSTERIFQQLIAGNGGKEAQV